MMLTFSVFASEKPIKDNSVIVKKAVNQVETPSNDRDVNLSESLLSEEINQVETPSGNRDVNMSNTLLSEEINANSGEGDINPLAIYYINRNIIAENSDNYYVSPSGEPFNLTKGSTVKYDLSWFAKHKLVVFIVDVNTDKMYNEQTIKGGSASGSIKVPHNGVFKFGIFNKGETSTVVNGSVDLN